MIYFSLFNVNIVIKLINTVISINILALLVSPLCTKKYIAKGIVCVFPGILPATISVAPNSPKALANESMVPPIIPFLAKGNIIL